MIKQLIIMAILISNNPKEIATVNKLKREAEKAFVSGDLEKAISNYRYLVDSMDVSEDEIHLNLGHAYFQKGDSANARTHYSQASMSSKPSLKSASYQQLGVMAKSVQALDQSLQYLKAALKADPRNEGARYDYELVKKLLREQEKQQQNQQDQQSQEDQENQEQQEEQQENKDNQESEENKEGDQSQENEQDQESEQDPEQKDQEGEEKQQESENAENQDQQQKNQEMSTKEKLEEMNISEEKARMILEAMRNGEIQYLQQQKRKATERPKSDKPDW